MLDQTHLVTCLCITMWTTQLFLEKGIINAKPLKYFTNTVYDFRKLAHQWRKYKLKMYNYAIVLDYTMKRIFYIMKGDVPSLPLPILLSSLLSAPHLMWQSLLMLHCYTSIMTTLYLTTLVSLKQIIFIYIVYMNIMCRTCIHLTGRCLFEWPLLSAIRQPDKKRVPRLDRGFSLELGSTECCGHLDW